MSVRILLKKISILLLLCCVIGCSQAVERDSANAQRPNIVLILADDMGYSDIGCYGGEIETPNLDRLAENGLRFTQFYNAARCCPTRASLLTGLYPHQAGMGCMEPDWNLPGYRGNINKRCVTIAEALNDNGYATYMAGKWHVTNKTAPKTEDDKYNWPCQRGFDRFYGTIAGAGNFFMPRTLTRDNENIEQEARQDDSFYYTDAISDNAAKFITDHAKENADKPFFLYTAYTAPHWPLHAKEEDIKKYRGQYDVGWDVIRKQRHERMIEMGIIDKNWKLSPRDERVAAWDDLERSDWKKLEKGSVAEMIKDADQFRSLMAEKMATYAAMIDCMDQGIGRIIQALKETGQYENTLIVFLSDNGGCDEWGTYGFGWDGYAKTKQISGSRKSNTSYGPAWAHVSNNPFRLYKLYMHEGGVATPLVVHWPAKIKESRLETRQVGHIIDVMPTFIEAAGGSYPVEYNGNTIQPMEGVSLIPSFEGKSFDRPTLFWEHIGNRAVRSGDWKLVARGETGSWELYNLAEDRTEMNNLAGKMPDKVEELSDAWVNWAQRCNVLPLNPMKKRLPKIDPAKFKYESVAASHTYGGDKIEAILVEQAPRSSSDTSVHRWTSWPQTGKAQWCEIILKKTEQIKSVGVYWYNDNGGVQLPGQWHLEVPPDAGWKKVEIYNTDQYSTLADKFNTVHLAKSRKTDKIRIVMSIQQ